MAPIGLAVVAIVIAVPKSLTPIVTDLIMPTKVVKVAPIPENIVKANPTVLAATPSPNKAPVTRNTFFITLLQLISLSCNLVISCVNLSSILVNAPVKPDSPMPRISPSNALFALLNEPTIPVFIVCCIFFAAPLELFNCLINFSYLEKSFTKVAPIFCCCNPKIIAVCAEVMFVFDKTFITSSNLAPLAIMPSIGIPSSWKAFFASAVGLDNLPIKEPKPVAAIDASIPASRKVINAAEVLVKFMPAN